jgi:hypothetical protein
LNDSLIGFIGPAAGFAAEALPPTFLTGFAALPEAGLLIAFA